MGGSYATQIIESAIAKENRREQQEAFDSFDYNNQRNFLWKVRDIVRGGKPYDWENFPYSECLALAQDLADMREKKLTGLAMALTDKKSKIKLQELLELG